MQLEVILAGIACKAETRKESIKTKTESRNFFCIVWSKVSSFDKLSCPQIWTIEQEKDREKEKVGGRPSKLNDDRDLEREIKNR